MEKRLTLSAFSKWLNQLTDPYVLGAYRIIYGLFMAYTVVNYFEIGLIRNMFVLPTINFQYDFLRWLKPVPEMYMNFILGAMLICAMAISAGLFFKWACRLFALGYAYILLLDKSIYNNHIYLFILMAILMSMTDADRCLSIRRSTKEPLWIPQWQVFILQLQIVIVYFYGGIAKLTYDWIVHCQPVRTVLEQVPPGQFLTSWFKNEVGVYLLNYGGLLIDLGAPLLLWYTPVRRWAIALFIGFNFLNSRIFVDIGIFPYVMMASLLLFYKANELPFINRLSAVSHYGIPLDQKKWEKRFSGTTISLRPGAFVYFFFAFQLLFPLRGHFLPNPLDWTTIGNRFAWRMKVDTRGVEEMKFYIHAPAFDDPVPVDINTFINDRQIIQLSMDPRSVVDFANHLKTEAIKHGTVNPKIKASIAVKYNGRETQFFIDPDIDLTSVQYDPFVKLDWVSPVPR